MIPARLLSGLSLVLFVLAGCSGAATTTTDTSTTSAAASPDTTQADASTTTDELRTALAYGAALQEAIDDYEAQRQATRTALDTATQDALQTLQNDPNAEQVRQATSTWRRQWNDVQANTQQLWGDLANAEAAAAQYFNHLERQTAMISDADLRASERERNESLKQDWRNVTATASSDIEALQTRLQQGNDLYITMLNASLRSGFSENIERLQTLSGSGLQLLDDLQGLTATGHTLLGRDVNDQSAASEESDASESSGR